MSTQKVISKYLKCFLSLFQRRQQAGNQSRLCAFSGFTNIRSKTVRSVWRQHQTTMDSTPAENSLAIKDRKVKAKSAKKRKGQESYYKSRKLSRACKLRAKKKLEERPKGAEGQCAEDSIELPDVLPDAGNMDVANPVVEVTAQGMQAVPALFGDR
ncbi:unnamed protein product [Cylicocyclus nassatus]|uniref:Uncharacterized protein n=1 Tax=Cylicocyclus nassatus TaxID=53992 RepID=A0AA36HHR6_CYLNA|nr:unnamed protein product [Cylicocyclus nassatus]